VGMSTSGDRGEIAQVTATCLDGLCDYDTEMPSLLKIDGYSQLPQKSDHARD
jgi:hypothetical protein